MPPIDPTVDQTATVTKTREITLKNVDLTQLRFFVDGSNQKMCEITVMTDHGPETVVCAVTEISTAAERTGLLSVAKKAHVYAATYLGFP